MYFDRCILNCFKNIRYVELVSDAKHSTIAKTAYLVDIARHCTCPTDPNLVLSCTFFCSLKQLLISRLLVLRLELTINT